MIVSSVCLTEKDSLPFTVVWKVNNVKEEDALDCVQGDTVANDVSAMKLVSSIQDLIPLSENSIALRMLLKAPSVQSDLTSPLTHTMYLTG